MTTQVPPDQVSRLQESAASGDEGAKALLAEIGQPEQPAKPAPAEEGKDGSNPPQTADKPAEAVDGEVDRGRDRSGTGERRPTKLDTIRELRSKLRELKGSASEVPALKQQVQQLMEKLNSLQNGQGKPPSDSDSLTELLAKPDEFLTNREKRLKQEIEGLIDKKLGDLPNVFERRAERAEAIKVIEGIKGFDRDQDEDELLDLMEEHGLDELAKTQPLKAARLAKKLWEERNNLPPETMADKRAATATAAGGTKPGIGKKPTLQDLNEKAKSAKTQEELDKVIEEIEALTKQ